MAGEGRGTARWEDFLIESTAEEPNVGMPERVAAIRRAVSMGMYHADGSGTRGTLARYLSMQLSMFDARGGDGSNKHYDSEWLRGLGDMNSRGCAYVLRMATNPEDILSISHDTDGLILQCAGTRATERMHRMFPKGGGLYLANLTRTVDGAVSLLEGCAEDDDITMLPAYTYLSDEAVSAWTKASHGTACDADAGTWDRLCGMLADGVFTEDFHAMVVGIHLAQIVASAADDMLPMLDDGERVTVMEILRRLLGIMKGSRAIIDGRSGEVPGFIRRASMELRDMPACFVTESEPLLHNEPGA